jgi:hypothetical protein
MTASSSDGVISANLVAPRTRRAAMTDGDTSETKATEQIPATAERRDMTVRHEGALIAVAGAVAALALGAVAVGAIAIGKLAIGHLALGRTRVRSGQVDELRIARLTIAELVVEQVRPSRRG